MIRPLKRLAKSLLIEFLNRRDTSQFIPHKVDPELKAEFVRELRKLAPCMVKANTLDRIDSVWRHFQAELVTQINEVSLASFLRIPVIQATMYESYAPFLMKEYCFVKACLRRQPWREELMHEDGVGLPVPFLLNRRTSGNLVHHIYHLLRFEDFAGLEVAALDRVIEFGGGYGSLCRVFFRAGFRNRYLIQDLTLFSLLQFYFLRAIGFSPEYQPVLDDIEGPGQIVCFNEYSEEFSFSDVPGARNLYIATWSLSEVHEELRALQTKAIAGSNYFLLAFRGEFAGFNNLAYFEKLMETRSDIVWKLLAIPHIRHSYYLLGRPAANQVLEDTGPHLRYG